MLTMYHIRLLIEECRHMGSCGLNNGVKASIPRLEIDILNPPKDFLGAHGNPAIFVNENTYNLLGDLHDNWIVNETIALKKSFLRTSTIEIIGAIVHETGHAFNVAANIQNTEANAYIYEIEVMCRLFEMKSPLVFGCSEADLTAYFESRLPFYKMGGRSNKYLAQLVGEIKDQFKLEVPAAPGGKIGTLSITFFVGFEMGSFATPWDRENKIISSKMATN